MKALVYAGPGKREVRDVEKPRILNDGDAIVRLTKTTICGTDLHILGGDVPACKVVFVITVKLRYTHTVKMVVGF